ncbi:hypothetical protein PFISCL1PPCAC_17209, partial [Pristionchus fissidentatus]
ELIFKDFVGKFSIIECNYRSRQLWGDNRRFLLCSIVTCYDFRAPMGKTKSVKNNDANYDFSAFRAYAKDQNAVFLPIFMRSNLSDSEFHALIILIMGELESGVSEQAMAIIDRYREEALQDLQSYYRNELGLTDYASRIGNLMSLSHAIQECKSLFKVFFRFYSTIFDLYVTNEMLEDVYL